jgi:hypothetical protein
MRAASVAFTGYANPSAILVRLPQRPLPDFVPSAWKYLCALIQSLRRKIKLCVL